MKVTARRAAYHCSWPSRAAAIGGGSDVNRARTTPPSTIEESSRGKRRKERKEREVRLYTPSFQETLDELFATAYDA